MIDIAKIKAAALAAIDDLDDYARMECSVEPVGTVNCLTDIINTLITQLEETKADLAHADAILIKIEKLLEGVEYRGDYAEGVRVLKDSLEVAKKDAEEYHQVAENHIHENESLREQVAQQAAQIELMRDALIQLRHKAWKQDYPAERMRCVEALSIQPSQALEQFAAKVRKEAFEAAANACDDMVSKLHGVNGLKSVYGIAIREMAKEMK